MGLKKECPGCLGVFEEGEGVGHGYIGASVGCWLVYGEVLRREFSEEGYFKVHRITVDAYGAQHIGDQEDRRARQSANIHLIGLYLYFEREMEGKGILDFLGRATGRKREWPRVEQRIKPGWLTVGEVIKARGAKEHEEVVKEWGWSVWKAYEDMKGEVIRRYEGIYLK